MDETVLAQLQAFLDAPSPESYLKLREAMLGSPGYQPYTDDPKDVHELLEQERYEDAAQGLMQLMPNWFLSPSVHKLLAFVFHKLGQEDQARIEFALGELLLDGLLSTGDGSEERPYLVLHTGDEYDVLSHFDKTLASQALIDRAPRFYDCLRCEDGAELWFDVTAPYTRLSSRF